MFETNLGASDEQLNSLHKFAEMYRDWQAELLQREAHSFALMREMVEHLAAPYQRLWDDMERDERRVVPNATGDGFIVVIKSMDRIRMAETTNPKRDIRGYLTKFPDISRWQEISMDGLGDGARVRAIFHWDRSQLDKLEKGTGQYWGHATEVQIGRPNPFTVLDTFDKAEKLLGVPESIFSIKK